MSSRYTLFRIDRRIYHKFLLSRTDTVKTNGSMRAAMLRRSAEVRFRTCGRRQNGQVPRGACFKECELTGYEPLLLRLRTSQVMRAIIVLEQCLSNELSLGPINSA